MDVLLASLVPMKTCPMGKVYEFLQALHPLIVVKSIEPVLFLAICMMVQLRVQLYVQVKYSKTDTKSTTCLDCVCRKVQFQLCNPFMNLPVYCVMWKSIHPWQDRFVAMICPLGTYLDYR